MGAHACFPRQVNQYNTTKPQQENLCKTMVQENTLTLNHPEHCTKHNQELTKAPSNLNPKP